MALKLWNIYGESIEDYDEVGDIDDDDDIVDADDIVNTVGKQILSVTSTSSSVSSTGLIILCFVDADDKDGIDRSKKNRSTPFSLHLL